MFMCQSGFVCVCSRYHATCPNNAHIMYVDSGEKGEKMVMEILV